VEVAVDEKIPIAVVSMGSPEVYTARLKQAGIKVIHVVGCVEHTVKAQEQGVDAVVCSGFEGGGHVNQDELTTMVLVPQAVDAVEISVIAGGGICDARGVVAALALGAHGVYMGTRFLATEECAAHSKVKKAVVNACNRSTVVFARKTGISRNWRNRYTESHIEMESKGASFEDLRAFERSAPDSGGWRRLPAALLCGNIEEGSLGMGAGAGLIKEIIPAGQVIENIVREHDEIITQLESGTEPG
jgi:NAD(P)H-dependent flavin oxidoreductase YrpB (nitropropane dioxygenase family)